MLKRRGAAAGVENTHAHRCGNNFAHEWHKAGGNTGDLMLLLGWASEDMPRRYGASAAAERAQELQIRMGHRRERLTGGVRLDAHAEPQARPARSPMHAAGPRSGSLAGPSDEAGGGLSAARMGCGQNQDDCQQRHRGQADVEPPSHLLGQAVAVHQDQVVADDIAKRRALTCRSNSSRNRGDRC